MRILLAEDNASDQAAWKAVLARRADQDAFHLDIAEDGLEAIEAARQTRPDLMVLNINMPGLDGWEVLTRLKAAPRLRAIPVVMWTIAEIEQYYTRAYESGTCGYFVKPVSPADMKKQINAILDYFQMAQLPLHLPE